MNTTTIEILLIEDNLAEAGMIRDMLADSQKQKFSVQHVQYLAEGLALLDSRKFDVILADLGLPDSQGLETAFAVREHAKRTPIVVLTILDDEDTALKALQMDIQDYLLKSEFSGSLLRRSICYAIQRKSDSEELRESRQRFESFMFNLPGAAWMKDLHGGYVYANAETECIFNAPFSQFSGKSDEEILPPETARLLRENDERVLAEGVSLQTTEVLRDSKGIEHHYMVSKFAIPGLDGKTTFIAGVAFDITERVLADEEIERLNTVLAARAAELEGANRTLADDLHAMTSLQQISMLFLHEEKMEQILSKIVDAAVAISGADFGNIQTRRPISSNLHIVAQRGFPQWWLEFWNSVTEGQGVCGTALERGERVVVEDVEQSPIFTDTDALEIQRKAGVRAVQSTPLVSRTGSIVGILSTHYKAPHRPTESELRLLDLLARQAADIIVNAHLREQLQQRAAELESANRELDAFSYSVAHDLRKPLTTINGYCQVIQELCGNKLDEKCMGYLQEVYDGTLRMNRLINVLLDFSRLGHVEPNRERVDLSTLAQEAASELSQSDPNRRVTFRIADQTMVTGDRSLLRVVLDNLLGNAWKYTSMREKALIEFGEVEIDGKPAYFVRDNGVGFDMADAGKLFTPFQRLPGVEQQDGFGIGLATVERIIQRHGGRIWAEGETGKGATFYFTLG